MGSLVVWVVTEAKKGEERVLVYVWDLLSVVVMWNKIGLNTMGWGMWGSISSVRKQRVRRKRGV